MSIDRGLERLVLAELRLRKGDTRRRDRPRDARRLAHKSHRGSHDLLAHLRRVARALPTRFRSVAWLHHAADVTPDALDAAGLSDAETKAIELLAAPAEPATSLLERVRTLSAAPGCAGHLARVVARAGIEDRLDGARAEGEALTALRLLPDPELAP